MSKQTIRFGVLYSAPQLYSRAGSVNAMIYNTIYCSIYYYICYTINKFVLFTPCMLLYLCIVLTVRRLKSLNVKLYIIHIFGSIYSYKSYHKISTNRFIRNCVHARARLHLWIRSETYEIMKCAKLLVSKMSPFNIGFSLYSRLFYFIARWWNYINRKYKNN